MVHKDPSRKAAPLTLVENHLGAQRVIVGAAAAVTTTNRTKENALPKPKFDDFCNDSSVAFSQAPLPIAAAPKPVQKAASPKKPTRASSPRKAKNAHLDAANTVEVPKQLAVQDQMVVVVPRPAVTEAPVVPKQQSTTPWKIEAVQDGNVSDDGLSVAKTSASHCYARGSQGWSSGVHEWQVKIESSNVDLGVVLGNASQTTDKYALDCSNGKAFDPSRKRHACLEVPVDGLAVGSCISLRLDLDRHALAFSLNNGRDWVEPFTQLPLGTYFPHFAIYSKNRPITVVSQK